MFWWKLGKSKFVILKRRNFYRERKRESCGNNRKYNGLGRIDERWSFRELKQYWERRKGLSPQRQNGLAEYKDRILILQKGQDHPGSRKEQRHKMKSKVAEFRGG